MWRLWGRKENCFVESFIKNFQKLTNLFLPDNQIQPNMVERKEKKMKGKKKNERKEKKNDREEKMENEKEKRKKGKKRGKNGNKKILFSYNYFECILNTYLV